MPQEEIRIGQLVIRFLLEGTGSNNSIAMFHLDVPAGAKVPAAHSHDAYEETIYGLEGILTMTVWDHVGGRVIEVGPGDVLCIPRGVVHRFDNLHPGLSRSLAVITPGILGPEYFREIAAVAQAAALSGTPPNPAAIAEVMLRHGLTPAASQAE